MSNSPSITVDSPSVPRDSVSAADSSLSPSHIAAVGAFVSPPRSRSVSGSGSAVEDDPSHPHPGIHRSPQDRSDSPSRPSRPSNVLPAQIRSVSRPSPVVPSPSVPSSPASFSRPTSPRPTPGRHGYSQDDATSPTRERVHSHPHHPHHELHAPVASNPISRTNSGLDLSHIFERDVEFNATHQISPQEAVDVAVAPVLDEAVVALSSPGMTPDIASLVHDSEEAALVGSGWSSPIHAVAIPSSSSIGLGPDASASRSPVRSSQMRSFSPDSTSDSARGASPESVASFSVGTPPDDRSTFVPFSQTLSEALEQEAQKRHPSEMGPTSSPPLAAGVNKLVPPVPFSLAAGGGNLHDAAGAQISPSPSFNALAGVKDERRRLSFVSYADVINEERLAELTGAPQGGEPTENAVDLATVLDRLDLASQESH
ncbi:BZ3500_MvSof-1268-A1-R1_Chr2-1g04562 [Microbotryum saponariae]|uniref:BZ3500_MvSof-1268-A1-R1_Chr2-1g04562 protein n=1 Tax=Microbotryum saponariae TaxID=289078 RepID=A0A2X0KHC6_9BASI|nr:BZ3500_MvSof-1268-A1-R1_Chr2-1g04562 [Microbotryum saponariae]SCZ92027.1 BZ3501_MvSof-1269-A2-R1_Chr2-1g04218 [Microbotryum saponariae]